jgi:hypothetical protein
MELQFHPVKLVYLVGFITKRLSTASAIGNIWAAKTEYQQQYPNLELHIETLLRMTRT